MGTPINGVIAAKGSVPLSPDICDAIREKRAKFAPISTQAGNNCLWSAVRKTIRAMCGTVKPINDIGPQRAVTVAVRMPVTISTMVRTFRTFIPKLVA